METTFDLPDDHLWNVYLRNCPCRDVLDLVANKWTALVLGVLRRRPHRFGELRREVEGISQKMLTQNLRNLERDGLISRTVYPTTPPSVEYALTDLGAEIAAHLVTISEWSQSRYARIRQARAAYDQRIATQPQPA
ncbi:winged helix-turn-helix transcriptional regulator [Goodfellowiella coeruleoviolacea]|uniref:Transcriptional regulator, HxlR family n=1 Tax=Goodfellowiella coeruleoviolacea TaxID=334858 RepID=A0AAE3KFB7_9PSEU|nr:helix-turn-helix domain-containing protein [Goodfellowiella coeruleoviolacea]MCP2164812.1 transcriptional regulator, HxlR family [Goodfellowiella coeruleoviolacea]